MRMGTLLIYSAAEIFSIWPRAPPRCRPSRASRGRKPIRRGRCAGIIGFSPGGSADLHARLIAQWLSKRLGQQFIIENRPGASTNIALQAAVAAAASTIRREGLGEDMVSLIQDPSQKAIPPP